jgi:transmembrane sensor
MTQIDWDLLSRHLAGTDTPSERQWIERMAPTQPDLVDAIAAAREIADDGDASVLDEEVRARLEILKRDACETVLQARVRPRFSLTEHRRSRLAIAAALTLVAGTGAAWLALHSPNRSARVESTTYSLVTTALGQRLSLRLSDSTLVLLAPGSTLRTRAEYGRTDREIELEGEALFTVTHDSTKPFTVRTPRAVAVDLGTRFVVRAYADDPVTDIVVADGQVAVQANDSTSSATPRDSLILSRGERARVADDRQVLLSRRVALDDYLDWTEGRLHFRGTPLRDAARRLERWYDIDIVMMPASLGERPIVATVNEDEPATDVLATIAASLDAKLSRAGRVFTLAGN